MTKIVKKCLKKVSKLENKLVCDFYFKNEKTDLKKKEYSEIKNLLKQCEDEEFFNSLEDF